MELEVVWTIFPRLLALIAGWAAFDLFLQYDAFAGRYGILPRQVGDKTYSLVGGPLKRWFYFPSLLWLSSIDAFAKALLCLSTLAGLVGAYLGPHPLLFLFQFVVYLSFVRVMSLWFPWDRLLLDSLFLAIFLPTTGPPSPLLNFSFRWLPCRLLLGFGKVKFTGSTSDDLLYLKPFLLVPPIMTRLGYYAHKYTPHILFKLGYIFYFLVEVPFPVLLLLPWYEGRVLAAVSAAMLMFGILLTGNFGFFNVLYVILLLPALARVEEQFFFIGEPSLTHFGLLFLLLPQVFLLLIANTWVDASWSYWPGIEKSLPWPILAIFRTLSQFGICSSYGVFPPRTFPNVRTVSVFEVSQDGKHWSALRARYQVTHRDSAPPWVGMIHQPRIEYYTYYFQTPSIGLASPVFEHGSPFTSSPYSGPLCGTLRVLLGPARPERTRTLSQMFPACTENDSTLAKPPKFVRVVRKGLTPAEPGSPYFWNIEDLYIVLDAVTADHPLIDPQTAYSPPELFPPEAKTWAARTLRPLTASSLDSVPESVWRSLAECEKIFESPKSFREKSALAVARWLEGHRHEPWQDLQHLQHAAYSLSLLVDPLVEQQSPIHSRFIAFGLLRLGKETVRRVLQDPERLLNYSGQFERWRGWDDGMLLLALLFRQHMVAAGALANLFYVQAEVPPEVPFALQQSYARWQGSAFPNKRFRLVLEDGFYELKVDRSQPLQ